MTLVSIPLMDRTGRRTLHLYGLGGMFIFSIFITISFLIKASKQMKCANIRYKECLAKKIKLQLRASIEIEIFKETCIYRLLRVYVVCIALIFRRKNYIYARLKYKACWFSLCGFENFFF